MSTTIKQSISISIIELELLLLTIVQPSFINLLTRTKVRMNKTGNPYHDKVFKVQKRNYLVGGTYKERIDKNGKKENIVVDFQPEKPKGMNFVDGSKVLLKSDDGLKSYIRVEHFQEIKPTSTEFQYQGNSIDREMFRSFEIVSKPSEKQPQERKVNVINFDLNNVLEVSHNGEHYVVTH